MLIEERSFIFLNLSRNIITLKYFRRFGVTKFGTAESLDVRARDRSLYVSPGVNTSTSATQFKFSG
jgi:hypothetical protein